MPNSSIVKQTRRKKKTVYKDQARPLDIPKYSPALPTGSILDTGQDREIDLLLAVSLAEPEVRQVPNCGLQHDRKATPGPAPRHRQTPEPPVSIWDSGVAGLVAGDRATDGVGIAPGGIVREHLDESTSIAGNDRRGWVLGVAVTQADVVIDEVDGLQGGEVGGCREDILIASDLCHAVH